MDRDLERTRTAILDAAERLFADRGYRGATMQAIADAAGLSRGMPGYAFGTKERLYEAVLERAFARPRREVAQAATETNLTAGPTETLSTWVTAYVQFLAGHPTYVRLMERAALDGGERVSASPASAAALAEGVAALEQLIDAGALRATDTRWLLVSAMALCFFPFAHQDTVLRPLGIHREDPEFVTEWVTHIIDLLTRGVVVAGQTP